MIKFVQGSVRSKDTKIADIVVTAKAPNTLKQYLIGCGMMLVGMVYLTYTAFRNGSKAFDKAELYALKEVGCIDWDPEEVLQ